MKKKTKLFRSILTIGMASSLFLAGCGNSTDQTKVGETSSEGSSDEKVVITFWDENAGPARTPIYEELFKRFEAENPDIDVEYVGIPNKSAKSKLDAAIAAEDTPDVSGVQTSWLPEFSVRQALLPLDDFFAEWSDKDKINPTIIDFNKNIVIDKKLYGIPYTQNLDILWYRPDLFEEKGVKAPETWDEFFTAVEDMTDKDKGLYGFTIRGGAGGSFQLQRMMYAYSGITNYFNEDGTATVNDPKHVEFLEKYLGLYNVYTPQSDITNGYKEMVAGFDTGIVTMVQHNIGSFGEHSEAFEPEQFAALPLPKSDEGKYVAEGGNSINFAIYKNTKHPEAAWKLVSFLASQESQSYWNQSSGQIPTHADVLDEQWVKDAQHIETAFTILQDPNMEFYDPAFYLPDYRSILDSIVDPGNQQVLSGEITVKEFLDKWANALETSKAKYDDTFK